MTGTMSNQKKGLIMEHEELYDEICRVLTWYEHPSEYPFGEDSCKEDIADVMYDTLVKVQNELFNQ